MQCERFMERLDAFCDGELNRVQSAQMLRHMQQCPECRQIYEESVLISAGLAELGGVEAPETLAVGVMNEIEKLPKPKRKWSTTAKVLTGVAAGFVGLIVLGAALLGGVAGGFSKSADTMAYNGAATASSMAPAGESYYYYSDAMPAAAPEMPMQEMSYEYGSGQMMTKGMADSAEFGLKIITNGSISLNTYSYDEELERILAIVQGAGGYVQSASTGGQPIADTGRTYGRYSYYTLRVPADRYADVTAQIKQIGNMNSYSESSEDITSQYYDTQARLEAYQIQYDTVEGLLEKAETLGDVLTIQSELTDLQYKIDSLTGTLKQWDFLVAYSTLEVDIQEVADGKTIQTAEKDFGERLVEGFVSGINAFIDGCQSVVLWMARSLITLVIIAGIGVAVFFIIRGSVRKRRSKKQLRQDGEN